MLARRCTFIVTAVYGWSIFIGTTTAAEPPSVANSVQQLLDIAWKPSPDDYATAQKQYDEVRQAFPKNVLVPYAMGLVAAKNHSPKDAAKYLDEAVQNGQTLFPIRRVKIWQDVVRKDKTVLKADLHELARLLSADPAMANRDDYQETARWLGVVLGYYAGPAQAEMTTADFAALDADIGNQVTGPLATALAAGKQGMADQSNQLAEELAAARKHAKEVNEAKQVADREKNDAALADAQRKATSAMASLAQLRQASNADQLDREVQKLESDLSKVNSRRNELQRAIKDFDDNEDQKAKNDKNYRKNTDTRDRAELDQVDQVGRQIGFQLNSKLPQQKLLQAQSKPLEDEVQKQKQLAQACERKAMQLTKPVSETDTAASALEFKYKSFGVYAGIDLEREKQRIVDSFNKK